MHPYLIFGREREREQWRNKVQSRWIIGVNTDDDIVNFDILSHTTLTQSYLLLLRILVSWQHRVEQTWNFGPWDPVKWS